MMRRYVNLATGGLALLPSYAAGATIPATEDERQIALCIEKLSEGRAWMEKTLWALRDQEGGWIGAEIVNQNGSRDLGPFQVNSWWVPHLSRALRQSESRVWTWLRDDPCFNTSVARWIYLSELRISGDYWTAIGRYHSPSQGLQRTYARQVAGRMAARYQFTIKPIGAPGNGGARRSSRSS